MSEALQQQKQIKIKGVTYTLQMVSASWYLETMDKCKNEDGNLIQSKYMEALLANVVAAPRVTTDSFTGKIYTLRTLIKEAEKFILGEEAELEEEEKNAESPEEEKQ